MIEILQLLSLLIVIIFLLKIERIYNIIRLDYDWIRKSKN